MIIGNGDLASVLREVDRDNLLFFASGVSDSSEKRSEAYQREINLLLKQNRKKHLVYFSSLAVFESNTRYIRHKREMEGLVKKYFQVYTIVRIGNIAWGTNPHTLINHLRGHKDAPVLDVYRYIVEKDEFLYWIKLIPDWSCEMCIPGKRMKVIDIKKEYCE